MKKNVGSLDRNVRVVLGTLLGIIGIAGYVGFLTLAWIGIGQALASVLVFLLGAILLVTGSLGTCPIYSAFGIDTHGKGSQEAEASAERPA